jgi:hypothetical protein
MKNRYALAACLLGIAYCGGVRAQEPSREPSRAPSREALTPTAAERDARLGWWREARFGMFVHWGVYSGLSGTWNGKAYHGYAEHIQRMAKIPIPVYRQEVAGKFNPQQFDAEAWISLAKQAGMGYFVITAKHHDGFAMFDSAVSDYNIVKATPFARDPMQELKAACKRQGLRFGFYYSHAFDWGEADSPGNDWDYQNPGGDRLLHGADWWKSYPQFLPQARKYVDRKSIPQLLELISKYDPDIIWFDTPHKLPPEENQRILAAVRKAKPTLVVNGRLVGGCGDYDSTGDRPAEFPPHRGDWEAVPTTNESYGYNQNDHSHKPVSHFIQLLAKAAARGGNVLMNIGPMGTGKIDDADVAILKGIGRWWRVNGESIRGTTRTPLSVQAWGESTRKGNRLYLHVFDWPRDGKLIVGGLKTEARQAYLLAEPAKGLATTRTGNDLAIAIPPEAPDAADSVIVVDCAAEPQGDPRRLIATNVPENNLRAFDGQLTGKLKYGPGKTRDAWVTNWTRGEESVAWPVRLTEKAVFDVTLVYDAPGGSGGSYIVQIGPQTLSGEVKSGTMTSDYLGKANLPAGSFEIRVLANRISGQELMRLRGITLQRVGGAERK